MFTKSSGASGVDDFAQVGARGNTIMNCGRDLLRASLKDCIEPEPYLVTCPINMPKHDGINYVENRVMLPSEIIISLLELMM